MLHEIDDVRIQHVRPLMAPAILLEDLPVGEAQNETIWGGRRAIERILAREDDRLVVVVGPCSIHDPTAGLDYARRLVPIRDRYADELLIVMRVYFEKPRTTVGWKGLINDPHLDGSFAIREGLRTARRFLLDVTALGLPTGSEFLDPIMPQFYADLVSWGAIGARTTESQVHRELASGLSMPVGFKNGTYGTVQMAIDGIGAAAGEHHFLSVTKQGVAGIVATKGNPFCHVILRGGSSGPNYDADSIARVAAQLEAAGLPVRIMVDCSHANSGKDHEKQPEVAESIASQVAGGDDSIFGVMMESFLLDGNQKHSQSQGSAGLVYGQSITDKCMSWERTEPLFERLAEAVRKRRGH
ncbi:MAG: 3-deoxy-7-phosphoheptulonate synthase [Spirochaetaceae bacterium]|nr:3-deoxy-7-phosphoheptulonate synthase [Myxococcales bacterium]MCB9723324.1 3-deoxy-7-phosphoheptulonate synthase [Spirochaetaceae bacterium]